jgi:PAS domain S-box-containing protein
VQHSQQPTSDTSHPSNLDFDDRFTGNNVTQAEKETRLLLTLSQAISSAPDFDQALKIALQEICQTTNWMYGEAWIPTTDNAGLVCSSSYYSQDDSMAKFRQYSELLTFYPEEEIPGKVWQTEKSCWVTDLSTQEDILLRLEIALECGLKAAFGVPIIALGNTPEVTAKRSSSLLSSPSPVLAVLVFFTHDIRPQDQRWSELVNVVVAQSGTILQQKKVQAEMQALFAAMTDVVTVRDVSGSCLNVIPTHSTNLYKPSRAMIGRKLDDDLPPEPANLILAGIFQAVSTQTTVTVEYNLIIDSKEIWLSETISPLSEETAILVARDITERKQAEEETRLLLTLSQAISSAPDFDEALKIALQEICQTTNWMYGEAWIPTTDNAGLVCSSSYYSQDDSIAKFRQYSELLTFYTEEEIPGSVWQTEKSCWVIDLSTQEDILLRLEIALECGLKAAFGVPIIALGNTPEVTETRSSSLLSSPSPVLAVLVFFTHDIRPQDQRWSELVNVVVAQSGTILQQKKVQAEMQALFAAMTDVVTVRDVSGSCLNVIPTHSTNLYKPSRAMIGRKLDDDLPPEPANLILAGIFQAVSTQKTVSIEYSLIIDGKEIWLSETISPLSEETAILVARDITKSKQAEEALRQEQEKSEKLLRNILPETIANKLKEKQGIIAEQFNEVSILFADIVNFTSLSSRLKPIQIVNILNRIFSEFDELAEQLGLEKIKTIGDAYMVVAGLPIPRADHAQAIAQMALGMQAVITRFQSGLEENLQIRIGINTGVVVAGVIGTKKFIYDLWGDSVNVAYRMEAYGEPGKIQVTAAIYKRLKNEYLFEKRGTITVKGKGKMVTYWLIGTV